MKKLVLFSLSLLFYATAYSQVLTGVINDATNKSPIADVSVYLDGTSIYTTTNSEGRFILNVGKAINTSLVISHMSYIGITISKPFETIPNIIYLKEKVTILDEAVVVADQFTRAQKLKAFREQFLGTTKAGKSCRILNEDDIKIRYNREEQTLSATCSKPIVINNSYLGYKIQYSLIDFNVQYFDKNIKSENARQSLILGTSAFVDTKPADKKIQKRRNEVYEKSSICFFKNFANKTLDTAKLQLFNLGFPINPDLYFTISDTLSMKMLKLIPNTNIDKMVMVAKGKALGKMSILYDKNKKYQSEIIFLTDSFLIDQYGNINAVDKVLFAGYMGQQRVGNMLPMDYEPKREKN